MGNALRPSTAVVVKEIKQYAKDQYRLHSTRSLWPWSEQLYQDRSRCFDSMAADQSPPWLTPGDELAVQLAFDFEDMRPMFFQEPPPFEEILESLAALERRINKVDPGQ